MTGPGGAGKTRLAGEVARQVADRFADGVWLVELAAVRDPAQVAAAVAAALGIRELAFGGGGRRAGRVLARRQLLLVLDNCEHVIDAAAELCGRLLLGADDVRVLATSREPLRIGGETPYRLAPLSLPDPENVADLDSSEAVALFADRARQADAGFALDGETGPVVARLVARLDGMPLAIELAAARVEALGVAQLLDRIDDRFTLLEAGDRLAGLPAAVAGGCRRVELPAAGRTGAARVPRAVSVFPGPFTLARPGPRRWRGWPGRPCCTWSTARCWSRRGRPGRAVPVRDAGDAAGLRGGAAGRGWCAAMLAAGALAGYALRVAADASLGRGAGTGEVAAARPTADAEDATMRAALDWALERDAPLGAELAVTLAWWWQIRGRLAGQVPVLRKALDRAAPGGDAWCAGQLWLGQASLDSADPGGALRCFTAVRDTIGDREAPSLLARCLSGRSTTLLGMGRIAEAAGDARRALALVRDGDHPVAKARALAALSLVACAGGNRVGARQLASQAERILAGLHGPMARVCAHTLTTVLIAVDDVAAAERTCVAGLAAARDAGDLEPGEPAGEDGGSHLGSGRYADAAWHLREALQTSLRAGVRRKVLEELDCCGYLCALTGRPAEAVTVWAAVLALGREGFSVPLHPDQPEGWFQRQGPLHEARQALGPAQRQAAEERGQAMSLATAAEYVLMLTAAGPPPPAAAPGLDALSPRERELVTLVARGTHRCADRRPSCTISVRTVSSHLDRIRDKTGSRRRADLTRLALGAGLVWSERSLPAG